ncbi:MAG: glycosyltransferase family 2 protein [Thaumarchaeota archaeon]|nr:glycosyltransferase family 2 protein [Nitrososphaerota archaeon]
MGTYFAIVTCRNSKSIIEQSLLSLKNQTLKPRYVVVINDGSTDGTDQVLKKMKDCWKDLYIITNPDLGYDIGRVVSNWNKALKLLTDMNLETTDYHMISADDDLYEEDYAEKIIKHMDENPKLAVVAGVFSERRYSNPTGGGRFVRNSFFLPKYGRYPEKMGYESAVLYMALRDGYENDVLKEAKFKHIREIGSEHHFYEFGAGMKTLGYDPFFVVGRFLLYFITGSPVGRRGALNMLYYYLTFSPTKEGYNSMYDKEIRDFIRSMQRKRIKSIFKKN